MFLYIFKIIIKLIMTLSRFDPGSTSIRPQKPWTSPFYSSMNGPGLKTLNSTPKDVTGYLNLNIWYEYWIVGNTSILSNPALYRYLNRI